MDALTSTKISRGEEAKKKEEITKKQERCNIRNKKQEKKKAGGGSAVSPCWNDFPCIALEGFEQKTKGEAIMKDMICPCKNKKVDYTSYYTSS